MWQVCKRLLWISRPISWPNTAYPFAIGYLVAGGGFDLLWLIGTLYFLIPYNLLLYGVNDVFDYESDILNPRKGGIEGMREQRAFHPTIMWAALVTNVPFLGYFLFTVDTAASLTFLGVIFMVIAYSMAHLRFKERPFLDSITSSSHFVGPLVFALSIQGFPDVAWPYVIAFFLWGMASHAFGAIQDIIPDRAGSIASIATVLGARKTVWFSLFCYVAAVGIISAQGWPALAVGIVGLSYCINVAIFMHVTDLTSARTNVGWRRFLWLNYVTGFVVSIVLLLT